jgi:hypothetical protein
MVPMQLGDPLRATGAVIYSMEPYIAMVLRASPNPYRAMMISG